MNAPQLAMLSLCCGVLMVALDATVVNVAVPSIARDLHFPETSLPWMVNAYLGTFGGFLLLAGSLGDVFGHRRAFVFGVLLFTTASLLCGVASSAIMLIVARAAQGFGGALVSTTAVVLILTLFPDASSRARALGIFALIGAIGGSAGVFLGGTVVGLWNWRWVFFINVPVGVAISAICWVLMPRDQIPVCPRRLDVAGAVSVTAALMLANYALLSVPAGSENVEHILPFIGSGLLLMLFIGIENRVDFPIVPLALLGSRNLAAVNIAGALLSGAALSWTFVSSLYMQRVLDFTPFQAGAAFLPVNFLDALISILIIPRLMKRFKAKSLIVVGMLLMGFGLALFARIPIDGTFMRDVLPGMVFLGMGIGVTYGPLFLSAMSGVPADESGAVSGIVNASWTLGGTVGLTLLLSTAMAHTGELAHSERGELLVMRGAEYQTCFCLAAIAIVIAATVSGLFIHTRADELQREVV